MSGLLPDAVRDAIAKSGVIGASDSFGIVTLVLLIVVLTEHEVMRVASSSKARTTPFFVSAVVLSCAVGLTIAVRIGRLL